MRVSILSNQLFHSNLAKPGAIHKIVYRLGITKLWSVCILDGRLLRRSRKYAEHEELPDPSRAALISRPKATEPTPPSDLVAFPIFGQAMDSQTTNRTSLSQHTI